MAPRRRLWLFRLVALVGAPAVFLGALEGVLRLADFGRPVDCLIPDAQPGWYRTNPDYLSLYLPGSFDLRPLNFRVRKEKPPGTIRIVVLGESAAQGIPDPMFGFAPHLRAQLRARHPDRRIEVINTGVVAINSHVVRAIAREMADYSPDLFVVYLGNNEVVGPYAPGCSYLSNMPPRWAIRASVVVRSTRTGQLLGRLLGRLVPKPSAPAEWGGMAMFVDTAVRGDDPRLAAVYDNFAANLDDILAAGRNAGARVVVSTLVFNLKDCPPFLSLNRPDLAGPAATEWGEHFQRGRLAWLLEEKAAAHAELSAALALDPQHAETAWMLGRLELDAKNLPRAYEHFLQAQRWDALRFRPDPRLNEAIRAAAAVPVSTFDPAGHRPDVVLVDAARALGSEPDPTARELPPPAGREFLFEHVHLNWEGNHRLGRMLAEAAEDALGLKPGASHARPPPPWLDAEATAAALGYTPAAIANTWRLNSYIVQQPPFSGQVTYPRDQPEIAAALAAAQARARDPAQRERAVATLRRAAADDPENPFLAKLLQEALDDRGDLEGALAELRRGQTLQPENFALRTDEAIKLARLGRLNEAEKLLRATYANAAPRDRLLMLPAFADLFIRTRRPAEGRAFLSEALEPVAGSPAAAKVLLLRARLALLEQDRRAAETDLRAARLADPRNPEALEGILPLLSAEAARAEIFLAATQQPLNQANHLRAAILAENDPPRAIEYLRAAARSGPLNSGAMLRLARLEYNSGQRNEALLHLAHARWLAGFEKDEAMRDQIGELIKRIRAEVRE